MTTLPPFLALSHAGGLNASLDLAFALDGSYTSRIGPLPVFTRASSATRIRADGLLETVGNNVARIDYDPVTLACRGLLIEPQRTNRAIQGTNFSDWGAIGPTRTLNAATGPSGATDAMSVAFGAAEWHQVSRYTSASIAQGVYTISVYAKSTTGKAFRLGFISDSNGYSATSGNITATSSWVRYSFTFTTPSAATDYRGVLRNSSTADSGTVLFSRCQIEFGADATSFIPTTTAIATRSADVCSISGGDFSGLWNPSEGTVVVSARRAVPTFASVVVEFGTVTEGASITHGTGTAALVSSGGEFYEFYGPPTTLVTTSALALKANDFTLVVGGGTPVLYYEYPAPVPMPVPLVLNIGAAGVLNGHIQRIRYFRSRLTNAAMQLITV